MKYKYVSITYSNEDNMMVELNILGKFGWELVSVCYCESRFVAFLMQKEVDEPIA
jgi:hypothetical protein